LVGLIVSIAFVSQANAVESVHGGRQQESNRARKCRRALCGANRVSYSSASCHAEASRQRNQGLGLSIAKADLFSR
jgi:hypothetical protein